MPGATMMKQRGSYAVRTTRKAKLLPARQYSMKAARSPELRLAMQLVSRPHRHQAPRPPVKLELGELVEEFEQISSFRPTFRSPRRRTRLHVPSSRSIKSNDEHSRLLKQQQSTLPESMWCMIQDMITNAKSLGDITRITLTFFKEHEIIQTLANSEFSPAFPIVIPASEVYNMLVPRKRRIYDVLHVLEGIGVIKRVRGDEVTGAKGGSFLYFGKEAAIQHLNRIQHLANETVERLSQHRFEAPSVEEIDIALLKMCEDQAEVERWPGLTTTTTSFLSLLLLQGITEALALPAISNRLVEAKKNRDPNFTNESAHADVNRRVYDVVSVLASCNLVLISVTPDASDDREDSPDRISSRKHVRFNHTIFDDSSSLKIADVSARKLSSHLQSEKLQAVTRYKRNKKSVVQKKKYASKSSKTSAKSRLSFGEADLQDDTLVKTVESNDPFDTPSTPVESAMPLRIDLSAISAYNDGNYFGHRVKSLPRQPLQLVCEDLRLESFCSIIRNVPHGMHDWWDDSLQELLFQDALPSQDLLRWEQMMSHTKKEEGDVWGQASHVHQPQNPLPSPHLWADTLDLKCYEEFVDDDDAFTDSFFTL